MHSYKSQTAFVRLKIRLQCGNCVVHDSVCVDGERPARQCVGTDCLLRSRFRGRISPESWKMALAGALAMPARRVLFNWHVQAYLQPSSREGNPLPIDEPPL